MYRMRLSFFILVWTVRFMIKHEAWAWRNLSHYKQREPRWVRIVGRWRLHSSWAGGGDEVASTPALAPAHRCHRPEKTSAGEQTLFSHRAKWPPVQEDEDYGRGNRLSGAPAPAGGRSGRPDLSMDVGQFPYPRGETPVFNFDQGDEVGNF